MAGAAHADAMAAARSLRFISPVPFLVCLIAYCTSAANAFSIVETATVSSAQQESPKMAAHEEANDV
jgi:hypothetical protein